MNRRNIVIAIAAAAVVAVGLALVISSGGGATSAAEDFLALVGSGKAAEAYDATDLTLQTGLTKEQFIKAVKQLKLTSFESVSWTTEDIAEDEAELAGTMDLQDGSTAPVKLTLILTEDEWRVSDLHFNVETKKTLGFQVMEDEVPLLTAPEPAVIDQLPSKAGLRYLTTETILKIDEAVKSQDFNDFYNNYIARQYKKDTDINQFMTIFAGFYTNKIDLSEVRNFAPIYDAKPEVANGYFTFTGRYPTFPPTLFSIIYVYEDGMWKVFHIQINR